MQREPPVPGEILGARNFAGQSFERPGKPGWSKCHRSRDRFSDLTHGSSSESIVGAHQERKDKRTYLLCSDRDNRFHFCIAFPGRKLNVIYMLVNDLASSWQIFTKMLLCRGWWRRAVSLVVQGRDRCKEKGGMIGEQRGWNCFSVFSSFVSVLAKLHWPCFCTIQPDAFIWCAQCGFVSW